MLNKIWSRILKSFSFLMKRSKLYTRTGDKGTSALFTLERRSKNDPVFQAIGSIDELNSNLAFVEQYYLLNRAGSCVLRKK